MSNDESGNQETSYSAYGHLKKEVAQKQAKRASSTSSAGIPNILKVFIIGLVLFGGLLASGVLTGPGPFGTDNGDSQFQQNEIPTGQPNIEGLTDLCVNHDSSGLSAHYHFDLYLFIDDQSQEIPANVGIDDNCMRPLHTHGPSGHIHVELPSDYDGLSPNLADFFQIWGKSFSDTQLLGQSGSVTMTVNDSPKTGQLQYYIPSDGDTVQISLDTSSS